MSESGPAGLDAERRLANLRAVAEHRAQGAQAPETAGSAPATISPTWQRRWLRFGPLGVLAVIVLSKLKLVGPFLATLLSMLLSIGFYGMLWGWTFAVGFVLLILVHESGHAVMMRRQGIPAGAPVFIPFVGAVIAMRGYPRNAWVEALVAIAGPVAGSAGALACFVFGWLSGSPFWYALAATGFFLNLFNLLPISPLDGGRIVGVIGRWLWAVGYALGIAALVVTGSEMLFLILLLSLFNLRRTIRGPHADYFAVPRGQRLAMGAAYFGLVVLLAVGMWLAERPLEALSPSP